MATLKEMFPGHYEPSAEDVDALWRKGMFVIDANVLLQLYSLPEKTRQQTLSAFEKLGDRIWMPYQVAVEYQRNRIRVIAKARERGEKVVEPLETALQQFVNAVAGVQLERRGLESATANMAKLLDCGNSVIQDAKSALASQVDLRGGDAIRDSLNELFENRIGAAPSQEKLNGWYAEAKTRYEHRMGPGHEDSDKKNPTFMHGDVVYKRIYGDYVLWMQSIEKFRDDPAVKGLVIITQEKKVDWWEKHNEKVAGPQPELCAEIRASANLDRFWMYDLEEFLQEAQERLQAEVSETTLSDVAVANTEDVLRSVRFNKKLADSVHSMRTDRRQIAAQLGAMGVDVQITNATFSAGPVASMDNTWAIAMTPLGLRDFMAEEVFPWFLREIYKKGARNLHFYCLAHESSDYDPWAAIRTFSESVESDFYEETVSIHYYVGDFEGNFQMIGMTRT